MGVANLEYFNYDGDYQYNISVEATEEKMGTCSDNIDVPVDIRYSHGSWSIMSMLNPSNVINILNSTNASVGIEFSHSECANYDLNGTLYVTPGGNTDIFTLDDISREIDITGDYSTSESFEVIGCSEERNDIIVDIWFYGYEYEYLSSLHNLTAYALVVSNQSDNISMFTGLEDADNDGTNNINDLDNAGDFVPILIKTHESATNAEFRIDFDENKLNIWTEDSNAMTTRTNLYIPNGNKIQSGHEYSYSELFNSGAEKNFYVQGVEAGKHDIDVTYVLDGYDLPAEELSVTFVKIDIDINGLDEEDEISIGAFVPINADNDNGSSVSNFIASCKDFSATNYVDDDLIELSDICLEIPQFGTKHSLNISVSLGIVTWEVVKRMIK
jgi:hypothetical protein